MCHGCGNKRGAEQQQRYSCVHGQSDPTQIDPQSGLFKLGSSQGLAGLAFAPVKNLGYEVHIAPHAQSDEDDGRDKDQLSSLGDPRVKQQCGRDEQPLQGSVE